ncbi:Probable ATP-dependent RNA helicase Dbp45A [Gryllus bimaculatus]|nr:Probable ATP-dependent RNA helicase Dbp45A [Gryllus bimaculatus]
MNKTFNDLKLNSWLVRQCESLGVKHATPIQAACIPRILNGEDCIGCAKTGSGKTLAFALPILQKLCEDPYGIFALVLTPTRELAFQIADQFAVLGKVINLRHSVIVGGMDMVVQGRELSCLPHIVVATPGRLADHLKSCNTFTLKKIKFLVLDEADRLLDGKFDIQMKTIFSMLPKEKQMLMFSATMNDTLQKVQIATVDQLEQFYVLCPVDIRDGYLVEAVRQFLIKNPNASILIFTDTCKSCQLMSMTLNEIGLDNVALHSMASQRERLAALAKFKSNQNKILVATDVASRGLDIPAVGLVVNHIIPNDPKDYVHRVGRTARAGRVGSALSLVTPADINVLHAIESFIGTKLEEFPVDGKEVARIFTQVSVTKREAEIRLDETDFYERKETNKRKNLIMEGKDPDEEAAKIQARRLKWRKEQQKKRREKAKMKLSNSNTDVSFKVKNKKKSKGSL